LASDYGWIVIAALIGGAVLVFHLGQQNLRRRREAQDPGYRPNLNETYEGLRRTAINRRLSSLGLVVRGSAPKAFSVVIDWEFESVVATLSVLITGDVELYLSDGGGTLGGIKDPQIRAAAVDTVKRAAAAINTMERSAKYPLPQPGHATFYLLMSDRTVFTAEVPIVLLETGGAALSPSWSAAQTVFNLIRGL
jgi:hypothetical protein